MHLRGCVFHATARPTPRLQRALSPYLKRFDRGLALVAVHLRTKFVDDVGDEGASGDDAYGGDWRAAEAGRERARAAMASAPGNFSLAAIRRGPLERRWRELNRVIAAGGFSRRNDDELVRRCPSVTPERNGVEAFTVGGPSDAGLNPYLTCAGRAAQLAAAERAAVTASDGGGGNREEGEGASASSSDARWSLYVATDAPYVKWLTSVLPSLRGRVVGCRGRCIFRHTSHGVSDGEEEAGGHDRFLQSFVDGYILGLADHCLPVTASTFPQLAHRGFGVRGRPQMLDRDWDGFTLQGGGQPWSNKHLPLCEAVGLDDGDHDGKCRDVVAAVLGKGARRSGGSGSRLETT